jgi:hypothetical protein
MVKVNDLKLWHSEVKSWACGRDVTTEPKTITYYCSFKKGNRKTKSLAQSTSTSYSWIWVYILGHIQKRDKFVGPRTEEICSIYKSHVSSWLGKPGST